MRGAENLIEYSKVGVSALFGLPIIAAKYLRLKKTPSTRAAQDFVGLSVSPDDEYDELIVEMVEELGAHNLLLRIPSWDVLNLDSYLAFMDRFPGHNFMINVLQSRDSVSDVNQWQEQVRHIIRATNHRVSRYWIGNAINRTKWGCRHTGDYFKLQESIEELRSEFTELQLFGSSIIDFEPLLSWRTLWNLRRYRLDGNAALLYVNRRHSPYGTQYGIFDLENKLRLTKAMTSLSNRCADQVWITETNWPLLDTKPYTPNSGSPSRTVDEVTQAEYLKLYYQIAYQTGWVEGVYWWQLVNPGYGLVDHRSGSLRKMPSFFALKEIIDGDLYKLPAQTKSVPTAS